ncbi:hypothetical protein A4H02_01490 [Fervidobacterium thailandense]|uniref:Uncharacterized protein n=1 Tax=Fervidobacterium thailandense TaxID=1008305 RepID=A0A1E3G421_9BACT|nr:hypothetical protein A4H02_01490 [Fervidobacterium thailandense]
MASTTRKYIHKKTWLNEIQGFDTTYKIASDIKVLWLVFQLAENVIYVNEFLTVFSLGGTSNKNIMHILKANLECYKIAREVSISPPWLAVFGKMLWKLWLSLKTKFIFKKFKVEELLRDLY